jgi:hypothetical protein
MRGADQSQGPSVIGLSASTLRSSVILLPLLTACGAEPPERNESSRFATPKAAVDYFNEVTTSDPVDYRAFLERCHAETPLQEEWRHLLHLSLPVFELATAVRQRFGEEILPTTDAFSTKPNARATISLVEDSRAEASYMESDGAPATLYLFKVDGEWWISGYTLEYSPRTGREESSTSLRELRPIVSVYAKVAPDLRRRLEAGQFSSISEFRAALQEAAADDEHC